MRDADVICPEANPRERTKTPVTSLTSLSPLEIPQPHKCLSLASYPHTTSLWLWKVRGQHKLLSFLGQDPTVPANRK